MPPSAARVRALLTALLAAVLLLVALPAAAASAATPTPTPSPVPTGGPVTITAVPNCEANAQTGCVSGTLNDANGNHVKDVSVTLASGGSTATAKTDASGKFNFSVNQAGTYTISLVTSTLPPGVKPGGVTSHPVVATLGELQPTIFALKGTFKGSAASASGPTPLIQRIWLQAAQGLLLGLLLALASIGLSLIYGTTGLSNFAHAEQVTLGGFLAYVFGLQLGLPLWAATIVAVALCALSGYLQDRLLWGPLRRRGLGLTQSMVVTIGLSLAAEYLFQFFFGGGALPVSTDIQSITGPLGITPDAYLAMGISIVVLVAVGVLLQRTRIGRATRAVSDNRALAAASGIDVDRIIRLVWTVAMGLAGLAGVLYALVYSGVQWSTGVQILLLLFAAVTLGGLGTAFGALVGSIIIGIVVQMSTLVLSDQMKYATALLILIVVLIFRPQGILGRRERVG